MYNIKKILGERRATKLKGNLSQLQERQSFANTKDAIDTAMQIIRLNSDCQQLNKPVKNS